MMAGRLAAIFVYVEDTDNTYHVELLHKGVESKLEFKTQDEARAYCYEYIRTQFEEGTSVVARSKPRGTCHSIVENIWT